MRAPMEALICVPGSKVLKTVRYFFTFSRNSSRRRSGAPRFPSPTVRLSNTSREASSSFF